MNGSTALATTLVDELARCGMTDAVVAPGSRSAALAMALAEHPRVRLHVRIDERSAAFTALGLARGSGRPAAVVCTSGSAAGNLHPAVIEADTGRVPLLVLTADRPPELRAAGANQTIDQLGLYGRAVRWFVEVGVAEGQAGRGAGAAAYWRSTACHAWAAATEGLGGPPGPVHLNLAFREPLVPVPDDGAFDADLLAGREGRRPWVRTAAGRGAAVATAEVADLIEVARRVRHGLLVAGDGTAEAPLAALSRWTGWPVLAEPTAGARLEGCGVAGHDLLLRDDAFAAAHRPEVIVVIGRANLSPALPRRWPQVPRMVIDPHAVWADPARNATHLLVADPRALLARVVDELVAAGPPAAEDRWTDAWRGAGRRVRAAVDAVLDTVAEPTEPGVARDLAAWLPAGSTLVAASSMPIRDLATYAAARDDLRVLANRGASGIDGFVSTAVGVALAAQEHGEGLTAALAGDLSLLHDANGLLLRGQPVPELVLVVLDNDGGGIFSFLPQARFPEHFEQLFGTPHGVDVAALAAASGTGYHPLRRAADLPAVMAEAFGCGGVQLVHVRSDRDANHRLHLHLREVAAAALADGGPGPQTHPG